MHSKAIHQQDTFDIKQPLITERKLNNNSTFLANVRKYLKDSNIKEKLRSLKTNQNKVPSDPIQKDTANLTCLKVSIDMNFTNRELNKTAENYKEFDETVLNTWRFSPSYNIAKNLVIKEESPVVKFPLK